MEQSPNLKSQTVVKWLILILMLFPLAAEAQVADSLPAMEADLDLINLGRERLTQRGMMVLGGWAVTNMGYSGVQYFRTSGATQRFHQMNVWWNTVNLGLAASGLLFPGESSGLSLSESLKEQQGIEKMLLFNCGLDVGYVMAGAFMRERSRNASATWQDRLHGWGNSLMLQGGFLFAFDLGFYLFQRHNGQEGIWKLLEHVQTGPGTIGMNWTF